MKPMKKTKVVKPAERWFAIDADGWIHSSDPSEQLWDETLVVGPCRSIAELKEAIKECAEVEGFPSARFFIVKQESTLSLQPATSYRFVEGGELTLPDDEE